MTPPIDDPETLRRILANTDALLLDFDGPICSVFSGFPAPVVAQQLRDVLAEGGHTHLPPEIAAATDPFDILFYAATLGEEEARYVEAAFTAHEVEAIQTAQPTPGAHDLIHAWHATGRPLAIVSNNSVNAVHMYLDAHELRPVVHEIAARTSSDTNRLKPKPDLIVRAVEGLSAYHGRFLLIGDSVSDVQAAQAASVSVVGYANRPDKISEFIVLGVDAVTTKVAWLHTLLH